MAYFSDKFEGKRYFNSIDFHHLEFYVGNAKQSMYYYCFLMGFQPFAYKGPETGNKDSEYHELISIIYG